MKMDGLKCSECEKLGQMKYLKYFHINLKEDILKCESDTCVFPFPKLILRNVVNGIVTEKNPPKKEKTNHINDANIDLNFDFTEILNTDAASRTETFQNIVPHDTFLEVKPPDAYAGIEEFTLPEANPLEWSDIQCNTFSNLEDSKNFVNDCSAIVSDTKTAENETDEFIDQLISEFFTQKGDETLHNPSENVEDYKSFNSDFSSLNLSSINGQEIEQKIKSSEDVNADALNEKAKLSKTSQNLPSNNMEKKSEIDDQFSDEISFVRRFKVNENLKTYTRKLVPKQSKQNALPIVKDEKNVQSSSISKSREPPTSPRKFKLPNLSNELDVKHTGGVIKVMTKKQRLVKQKKGIQAILNAPEMKEIKKPLDLVKYIQSLDFPK